MSLVAERLAYKPFAYPWAYDLWKKQQQVHWLPDEVPLNDDVIDWEQNLTPAEVHLLTQIFRFFTQSDIEVGNCYHRHYLRFIKPTEVVMMLLCFANMETVHTAAYSHLLETVGMPAAEYDAFLQYAEMKEKFDFMRSFNPEDPISVAETMAIFGGFIEGLQLFASFAILLNFPRHNKMKGMGQIVTWSVRDETIHCEGITRLYHEWCNEHGLTGNPELERRVREGCREVVKGEDAFIDLAFEAGHVEGMTPDDVKLYIRYIADIRLAQLGFAPEYNVSRNPLPWLTAMLNGVEHANFFEARATEYSKAATTGDWDDGFD
jgi:ribonucleoside-diphosphate reductase beta chain